MKQTLVVSIALCLLALCAFGQPAQQGSLYEWHSVLHLPEAQKLPTFMYSVQKTDLLFCNIYTDRNDVNQFEVIVFYDTGGVRVSQWKRVPKMIPGFTIVPFEVPPGITKINVDVRAGEFTVRETAVFE